MMALPIVSLPIMALHTMALSIMVMVLGLAGGSCPHTKQQRSEEIRG
jgi:hypothetical protein